MLFSDGLSNRNTDKISDWTRKLHSKNLTIFALSSSRIRDEKELRSIASVPQKYHFISSDDHGKYGIDEREMVRRVCQSYTCNDTCSDNCNNCDKNCDCKECQVGSIRIKMSSTLHICKSKANKYFFFIISLRPIYLSSFRLIPPYPAFFFSSI